MNLRGASPRRWLLLAVVAVVIVVASIGPGHNGPHNPTAAGAILYAQHQRWDVGAPGVSLGVVRGGSVRTGSAGDVAAHQPFVLGSGTKSFTALAVMQLVEAGELNLDDPVVRHLPGFRTRNRHTSDRITVRQLLNHTSGIPTYAGVAPLSRPETNLTAQVAELRNVTADEPDTFTYSNANYEVLGLLIERISGLPYASYLRRHVLGPLDMRHTYTDLASARAAGLAEGHRIWFGVGIGTGSFYRADFLPSGFLVSTAPDLTHFLIAMLNGGSYRHRSVLSPAGVRTMTAPSTPATAFGIKGSYGFGWYQVRTGGLDLVLDPGIAQNTHTDLVLVPEKHVGLVLLADAESDLYLNSIPKIDLLAMNAASIASTGSTVSGMVKGYYLVYDMLSALVIFVYVRTLVRTVRRRTPGFAGRRWYVNLFSLWRELFVPAVLLVGLPRRDHEGWRYLVTGDFGAVAAVIACLGLLTAIARLSFYVADALQAGEGLCQGEGPRLLVRRTGNQ